MKNKIKYYYFGRHNKSLNGFIHFYYRRFTNRNILIKCNQQNQIKNYL